MQDIPDYTARLEAAIGSRTAGRERMEDEPATDGHVADPLEAIGRVLTDIVVDFGISKVALAVTSRSVPGYFRHSRPWAFALTVEGRDLALVHLLSIDATNDDHIDRHVDEILVRSIDVWQSSTPPDRRSGLRPWLGSVLVVQTSPDSIDLAHTDPTVWPMDPAFDATTRIDRALISLDRLVRTNRLDAAFAIRIDPMDGRVTYPHESLTLTHFVAALVGRCELFRIIGAGNRQA